MGDEGKGERSRAGERRGGVDEQMMTFAPLSALDLIAYAKVIFRRETSSIEFLVRSNLQPF